MDKSLEQLFALWSLHKDEKAFPVNAAFALSNDGDNWFKQVSFNPDLYEFTDIALQHIKNSTKTG